MQRSKTRQQPTPEPLTPAEAPAAGPSARELYRAECEQRRQSAIQAFGAAVAQIEKAYGVQISARPAFTPDGRTVAEIDIQVVV